MPVFIVGGGPCGLYLAWKLAKQEVNSIIIDPHIGEYYRPGHLKTSAFKVIQNDVPKHFLDQWNKGSHIKDMERLLHKMVSQNRRIQLIQGTFIRFEKDVDKNPVVVYKTPDGSVLQEKADTVFDCSGNKRAVLKAASDVVPDLTWPVKSKHEPVFRHHLLYYCNIDLDTARMLPLFGMSEGKYDSIEGQKRFDMIHDLQRFGWYHASFPTLYVNNFNNNGKHALYCAAPPHLKPLEFHNWVTMLVGYKTGKKDCKIEFLPSQKEQKNNLRQMYFDMNYGRLQVLGHKQDAQLPNILAIGDAQIGFDYRIAHGVEDGLSRIQELMAYVEGYNGSLNFFDIEGYQNRVNSSLNSHESLLMVSYKNDLARCITAYEKLLATARRHGILTKSTQELVINASLSLTCLKSSEKVEKLKQESIKNKPNIDAIESQFDDILLSLAQVLTVLSKQYQFEHKIGQESISSLLGLVKETANQLFRQNKYAEAARLYQLGAKYSVPTKDYAMAYAFYSNAAIAYKKLDKPDDLAKTCQRCLAILPNDDNYPIRGKIIFNLLTAFKNYSDHQIFRELVSQYMDDGAIKYLPVAQQKQVEGIKEEISRLLRHNASPM